MSNSNRTDFEIVDELIFAWERPGNGGEARDRRIAARAALEARLAELRAAAPLCPAGRPTPEELAVLSHFRWFVGLVRESEQLRKELDHTKAELERERGRLAACGAVAQADTPESAAVVRGSMSQEYRSASCDDVARSVDECMRLRGELKAATGERPRGVSRAVAERALGLLSELVAHRPGSDAHTYAMRAARSLTRIQACVAIQQPPDDWMRGVALVSMARALLVEAEANGYVLTIDLVPNTPLAMGNYTARIEARKRVVR